MNMDLFFRLMGNPCKYGMHYYTVVALRQAGHWQAGHHPAAARPAQAEYYPLRPCAVLCGDRTIGASDTSSATGRTAAATLVLATVAPEDHSPRSIQNPARSRGAGTAVTD